MLTTQQIEKIDAMLKEGQLPDEVAQSFGMSYGQLRSALLNSGKRWEVVSYRRLIDTAPAQSPELCEVTR